MEEHVFGINFLDRDIPGRRVGTFQSGPVVIKTVPERSNFSAKWSRGIGTGCVYSAHVRIPYRWLRQSPTTVSSWKIVFKDGVSVSFFHSFSFLFSSFKPENEEGRKKEREKEKSWVYIPRRKGVGDDRSFEKVLLLTERKGFGMVFTWKI